MRYLICIVVGCVLGLGIVPSPAWAGLDEDCRQTKSDDLSIRACSEPIRRNPRDAFAYTNRGNAYVMKGDLDRAISDLNEAIKLNPRDDFAYSNRGVAYRLKSNYDRAIADFNEAIKLKPRDAFSYTERGEAYRMKGDYDRAIADLNKAIALNPREEASYSSRGALYRQKGDYNRAIADLNEAIRIDPTSIFAFARRADAYNAKGDSAKATADYRKALALPAKTEWDRSEQASIRLSLGNLESAPTLLPLLPAPPASNAKTPVLAAPPELTAPLVLTAPPALAAPLVLAAPPALTAPPVLAPPPMLAAPPAVAAATQPPPAPAPTPAAPAAAAPGRRVALVMGNAAYRAVKALPNPPSDARDVAAALRAAGFTNVVERYDLGVKDMQLALKAFEEKAARADWAVVYYAGHGIEVDGRNYLIPIDAELKSASDVEDETVPLDRVMARVAAARTLQLLIVDACRDNPFAPRMAQPGAVVRNVGTRGLGRIEPAHNLYVAYSARHGEVALDGTGKNSPYAKVLVKHLAVPGLALSNFFIRVRAEVMAETGGTQRPFEYGSLIDENLSFRPVPR